MVSSSIPEHTLNTNNGWLSPEGKLIPCKVAEHLSLSKKLSEYFYHINIKEVQRKGLHFDPMKFLKKQGWIKLLTWDVDHQKFPGYKWRWLPEDAVPTQKQIDTIFDWCRIRNCALPKFISVDESIKGIVKNSY